MQNGHLASQRNEQRITAFHELFELQLKSELTKFPELQKKAEQLERQVAEQNLSPHKASTELLNLYREAIKKS